MIVLCDWAVVGRLKTVLFRIIFQVYQLRSPRNRVAQLRSRDARACWQLRSSMVELVLPEGVEGDPVQVDDWSDLVRQQAARGASHLQGAGAASHKR